MKDSKGNKISIGDRVKVLWNFDNQIYAGDVLRVNENTAEIKIFNNLIFNLFRPSENQKKRKNANLPYFPLKSLSTTLH